MLFNFTKAFDIVSFNILIHKLMKYGLGKWPVRWIENWLNCHAQRILISGANALWTLVPIGAHEGVNLETMLFKFLIDLDDGTECTQTKAVEVSLFWTYSRPDMALSNLLWLTLL